MNEESQSDKSKTPSLPKYVKHQNGSIRRVDKLSFRDREILMERMIKEQKEQKYEPADIK
jgi:hypothetical protein